MELYGRIDTPFAVSSMAFNQSGTMIAVGNAFSKEILIYDVAHQTLVNKLELESSPNKSNSLAFAGEHLVAIGNAGNKVYIYSSQHELLHVEDVWPCVVQAVVGNERCITLVLKLPYWSYLQEHGLLDLPNIKSIDVHGSVLSQFQEPDFENLSGFNEYIVGNVLNRTTERWDFVLKTLDKPSAVTILPVPVDKAQVAVTEKTVAVISTVNAIDSLHLIASDRVQQPTLPGSPHAVVGYQGTFLVLCSHSEKDYVLYDLFAQQIVYHVPDVNFCAKLSQGNGELRSKIEPLPVCYKPHRFLIMTAEHNLDVMYGNHLKNTSTVSSSKTVSTHYR